MVVNKYKLSFTAASLSISESIKIAEVYMDCRDWEKTKNTVAENNLLQSRTNSRTIRVLRELIQRLKWLSDEQLTLLVEGNLQEQKYLLWFAVCKTYALIKEFAVEVLRDKFLSLHLEISEFDYDAFYNRKADWNEELDLITKSTKDKLREVVFRMLKEAGLVTNNNMIIQAILSSRLIDVLRTDAPMSYEIFPIQQSDIKG
ncbi:MAG: DUF1819 family protein [Chloroflexota bacterium]